MVAKQPVYRIVPVIQEMEIHFEHRTNSGRLPISRERG
jgi:hypothetical protein